MTEYVNLWHPDSPGLHVTVRPCLLRRLGLLRSPFATSGEIRGWHRALKIRRNR